MSLRGIKILMSGSNGEIKQEEQYPGKSKAENHQQSKKT